MFASAIFDTSSINAVEEAGRAADSLMRSFGSGFHVGLTAMSAEEIIATKTPENREALLSRLSWLLSSAQCIWPAQEVIRRLIAAHAANPLSFDWKTIDVRARGFENAIVRRRFDDELCAEQRRVSFAIQKDFRKLWTRLRPKLDQVLKKDPSKRPTCYADAVSIATRDKGVLWGLGQLLYGHVSPAPVTEDEIKSFMEVCPPFRAACYGLVMAWYNYSLRPPDGPAAAGRNDLMMATYLPYGRRFVTDDWAQTNDLREVAAASSIGCEILSVKKLEESLIISV